MDVTIPALVPGSPLDWIGDVLPATVQPGPGREETRLVIERLPAVVAGGAPAADHNSRVAMHADVELVDLCLVPMPRPGAVGRKHIGLGFSRAARLDDDVVRMDQPVDHIEVEREMGFGDGSLGLRNGVAIIVGVEWHRRSLCCHGPAHPRRRRRSPKA